MSRMTTLVDLLVSSVRRRAFVGGGVDFHVVNRARGLPRGMLTQLGGYVRHASGGAKVYLALTLDCSSG